MFKALSDRDICNAYKCDDACDGMGCHHLSGLQSIAQAQMRENARELIAKFQQLNSGNAITGYIAVITPEEYEALQMLAEGGE